MEAQNDAAEPSAGSDALESGARASVGESEKSYRELVALSRVSAAVSGLRDLDAILEVGLDNVLTILNGSVGGIQLLDEQTQRLCYRVYRGLSSKYVEEMRPRVGEGIAGKVAQSGKAVLIEDVSGNPDVIRPDLIRTEGLRAFISVPLRADESVVGVLNVASSQPHRFTKGDMHLLHSIGDQLGVAIDQAKLHERLKNAIERYRQLARQTLLAQEEERRRIARELHDETSQSLSGLALNLQALVNMAEMSDTHDAEFRAMLRRTHALAVQIGTEVSRLMKSLRPTLMDTLGLFPAIRQYGETNLNSLGINLTFECRGSVESLPPEVEVGIFRFAQGALGNIARHSEAKNVSVELEYRTDELVIRIIDDGKGFDVSQITGIDESGRGRGLFSMKERIALLGGKCSVVSQPGNGARVTARVPLIRRTADAEDKSTGS